MSVARLVLSRGKRKGSLRDQCAKIARLWCIVSLPRRASRWIRQDHAGFIVRRQDKREKNFIAVLGSLGISIETNVCQSATAYEGFAIWQKFKNTRTRDTRVCPRYAWTGNAGTFFPCDKASRVIAFFLRDCSAVRSV